MKSLLAGGYDSSAASPIRLPEKSEIGFSNFIERNDFKKYAFVLFRFYTGTRLGEATGLKWSGVYLMNGKATIAGSRTSGEEN